MTFSLGLALTQWQTVEFKLFQLYQFLYGQSDYVALNATFHEMGLDVKMRAISALIEQRTADKSFHKSWKKTTEVFFRQKRLRDKLAHWTVVAARHPSGGYCAYLSPPTTDLRATTIAPGPTDPNAIDAPTLQKQAIQDFGSTSAAIHRYMMNFPKWAGVDAAGS